MNEPELTQLRAAHETFSKLVATVRPELLRYCARMMGSTTEGEDVVQDALARAFYELARLHELPALRAWLFRIAHNTAINALVARRRRAADRSASEPEEVPADAPAADAAMEQGEAVGLAVSLFLELVPAQRACVILKDVLGLSLEEIADVLAMSVPAVKAALHRGRARLRQLAGQALPSRPRAHTPELLRYVELFNARDWDGVRSLLASDVKLEMVGGEAKGFGPYFSNYGGEIDWHFAPAWMDGREVIVVRRAPAQERPSHVIELSIVDGRVVLVRDFVHAGHVVDEATFER
jgi:RNA polymerase sigma factor (sigma-70 family)